MYTHWFPIVPIQMPYRLFHPRYPLATTSAVKSSFFSRETPISHVKVFERLLAPYESLMWPFQMIMPVGRAADILKGVSGWWEKGKGGAKTCLLVVAGEKDVLCRPRILEALAGWYRGALKEGYPSSSANRDAAEREAEEGVRFRVVKGVAHHMQNEVEWEKGAEEILRWLKELQ